MCSQARAQMGWTKIPYSQLSPGGANTSPCPADGFNGYTPSETSTPNYISNCHAVIIAWNSMTVDSGRNRIIIWGGGHDDYAGNEVYGVELNNTGTCTSSVPCIVRYDAPNPPNTVNVFAVETLPAATALPAFEPAPNNTDYFGCTGGCGPFSTPTGSGPNSRHIYDGLVYSSAQDAMYAFGAALNSNGNSSNAIWKLALSSVLSSCAPTCNPTWTLVTTNSDIATQGLTTDIDTGTGLIWMFNQGAMGYFNPATNTYTHAANTSNTYLATGVVDPIDEIFFYLEGRVAVGETRLG